MNILSNILLFPTKISTNEVYELKHLIKKKHK